MRKTLLLAVLGLSTTLMGSAQAGDDGLFSPVRLGTTAAPTDQKEQRETRPQPLSSGIDVQMLLLEAGYTARIDERDTLQIEVSRDAWTAPVFVALADESRQLRMAMRLTEGEADTTIAPRTLRELLQANRLHWGAFFAIAGDPQRIELVKTVSNSGLDSEQLRRELETLIEMAEKTRDIWKSEGLRVRKPFEKTESDDGEQEDLGTSTATSTPDQTPAKTNPPAAATPAPSKTDTAQTSTSPLTGKWIATLANNEAFALQMNADSSFVLVHVKGSKPTKSKGTFTLAGTTLTLKGDDNTTIAGTIVQQNEGFTLTMSRSGGKSVSLTFKSGK